MTKLLWKSGTAYDFFISLFVLHHAAEFGLRPSWAAGVRQRISSPHREFLELIYAYAFIPIDWISTLPEPRDTLPVLHTAARLSPLACLQLLTLQQDIPSPAREVLEIIAHRGSTTLQERETLRHTLTHRTKNLTNPELDSLVKTWSNPQASQIFLQALKEYYRVFFAEEEARIRPVLISGLEHAQEMSRHSTLPILVENLSRGVQFEGVNSADEITLVPSYWSTPFTFPTTPEKGRMQVIFGCRPEALSIAPGAETPDSLMNALKSLADPTRLRILRYLADQPLTPTELSHRLRLRPPTVLHHLNTLRMAELVAIRVSETGEKRYTSRSEALKLIFDSVNAFLRKQD